MKKENAVSDLSKIKNKFKNVLIIDDDPSYLEITSLFANNFAENIITSSSVEKARKLMTPDIDLIITDYFIPNREFGTSISKYAKEVNPEVKVILYSGDLENINSSSDYNIDYVDEFLDKPVEVDRLYELIEDL